MQTRCLLVGLELDDTAWIALCGDVVPIVVVLMVYLPGVTLTLMCRHNHLSFMAIGLYGVIYWQFI
ncbi:MAG: hypothetical protein IIY18_04090, partial [Clostridia bacterium]|nr:hypothetical protein [Clostridia bacterium]